MAGKTGCLGRAERLVAYNQEGYRFIVSQRFLCQADWVFSGEALLRVYCWSLTIARRRRYHHFMRGCFSFMIVRLSVVKPEKLRLASLHGMKAKAHD
jgi:hypothetical protein